jgi:hypothetical protein
VAGALYKQCAELGKWIRAKFVRKVLIDASALSISDWQRRQILYRLDQTQRRSVNRQYRYVRGAIINFLYLLIRNAARFYYYSAAVGGTINHASFVPFI